MVSWRSQRWAQVASQVVAEKLVGDSCAGEMWSGYGLANSTNRACSGQWSGLMRMVRAHEAASIYEVQAPVLEMEESQRRTGGLEFKESEAPKTYLIRRDRDH